MRSFALALLSWGVVACEPKPPAVVSIAGVDAGPAPLALIVVADASAPPCTLDVSATKAFTIPPALAAIAPQYFHPGGRDGFNDLVPGSRRYRWYDPSDLQIAVEPPGDMAMIARSTKSFWIGYADSELRVARRGGHDARKLGRDALRVIDATEDRLGNAWVLASGSPPRAGGTLYVMRVNPDLSWDQTEPLTLGANVFDAAIAVTDDRTVGVAVLQRNENELRIDVWWTAPKHPWSIPQTIDSVTLPPMAVELSVRTTVDLAATWHGTDSIAVAWRPLAPKPGERVDAGTTARPPMKPVSAEVRIVLARGFGGPVGPPSIHPTVAAPLMGTTGIGPWPLHANGMRAATLRQRALFAWNDDAVVLLAGPADAASVAMKPRAIEQGLYRLVFREQGRDLDLLFLQSAGAQKMVTLGCGP